MLPSRGRDPRGARLTDWVASRHFGVVSRALKAAMNGEPNEVEVQLDGGNTSRWVIIRLAPVERNDEVAAVLVALTDITEVKEAQTTLASWARTLEDRVQERTVLAAAQAEDLRRLGIQCARAAEAERRRLSALLHDHIQQLVTAARYRLEALDRGLMDEQVREEVRGVRDLLNETAAATRGLAAELSPPILRERGIGPALEWLAHQWPTQHGIQVELSRDPTVEVTDPESCSVLFAAARELLHNATKHSGASRAQMVLSARSGAEVVLEVSDEGRGFDPAAASGDPARHYGLLSLRERVRALGGQVSIDAAPGRGTRVRVVVPSRIAQAQEQSVEPGREPAGPVPPLPGARSCSRTTRILLCDDHAVVRQGLRMLLSNVPGFEVVGEAIDGRDAVNQVLRRRPDVVLMDVTMPVMDGVAATRLLKVAAPEVLVVGLSMNEAAGMAEAMRDAGAAAYVCKSAPFDEIVSAIRNVRPVAGDAA